MSRRQQFSKLAVLPRIANGDKDTPHPDFSTRFHCIAEACEDTCCNGWTIPIDRRTVRAYQAHPTLAPFSKLLILNTDNPSSGDYARMPLTHSGNCAFLNPDKLCGIHQHFGPDLLSVACNSYPRETSHQFGAPETALNFSCPEAARNVLLDPSLLSHWRDLPLGARLATRSDPARGLRDFLLRLLVERSHPLWHRIALMGELCQQIPSLAWLQNHPSDVANLLLRTTARIAQPAPRSYTNRTRDLHFVTSVLAARVASPPIAARFRECLAEFMGALFPGGNAHATPFPSIAASPFLNDHPHLLENYLANHIVKYSYPFGHNGQQAPEEAHLHLAGFHCLVNTMLTGTAAHHGKALDTTHVIKLIQSFSRAIEHQSITRDEIVRLARQHHIGQSTAIHLVSVHSSLRSYPAHEIARPNATPVN